MEPLPETIRRSLDLDREIGKRGQSPFLEDAGSNAGRAFEHAFADP